MDYQDWLDLASVYKAGAKRSRGSAFNADRQTEADVLEVMAERCEEIAAARAE